MNERWMNEEAKHRSAYLGRGMQSKAEAKQQSKKLKTWIRIAFTTLWGIFLDQQKPN